VKNGNSVLFFISWFGKNGQDMCSECARFLINEKVFDIVYLKKIWRTRVVDFATSCLEEKS
jgi:hypothetical protein